MQIFKDIKNWAIEWMKDFDGRFSELGIKLVEVAGVAVLLVVVAFFALNWALGSFIHSRKDQVVPDIQGKSAMAALDILNANNLSLKKEGEEFDSAVPVGAVIRQIPPPGTVVREGKAIKVWFSQGGESVFAPNIVGLPMRNAELLLRQSQLLLGEATESYSLTLEKGLVIAQEPKADQSLVKNALVNVVVSAGPPPPGIILMPEFAQKTLLDVNKWASDNKLSVNVVEDPKSVFPNGTVLNQTPKADTVVSKDDKVEVTVSARKDGSAQVEGKVHRIHYEIAQGGSQSQVRMVIMDPSGEREVFNGFRQPGSKIDITVPHSGPARLRIFVNGVLVEEREMP